MGEHVSARVDDGEASVPQGDKELAGHRAVVTGSSRGIGRAIALELARAGADVLVHAGSRRDLAEQVREEISALGVESLVEVADFREPNACEEFVRKVWEHWGPCHIWVNNAGADVLTGPNARLPFLAKLDLLWSVDVRATVLLSRAVLARMKQQCSGCIINIGWDQAETGMEGAAGQLFATTKGAVMAFTKSLAVEAAPEVRVNCVAPGWIKTAWGERASASWQERAVREALLKRWGTPEDVAKVVAFLCSSAASFITGQILRVNGGAVRS
jgi:3-oxoacyl-[acyl-carrier protein] reductase